jgi:hydroxyacylglutathione hydrolase
MRTLDAEGVEEREKVQQSGAFPGTVPLPAAADDVARRCGRVADPWSRVVLLGPPGAERSSTIGRERATNTLLAIPDENAFVTALGSAVGSYPAYFDRLGEINRHGPTLLTEARVLHELTPDRVRRLAALGAHVVDVRPIAEYAVAHIPGSLSIELRDAFATWLGWLIPASGRIIVVRGPGQDPVEMLAQAEKVGYDDFGELAGGLPPGPLTAMCGHGERAMTAASILERAGRHDISVLAGGPDDWAAAHEISLERGT